MLWCALIRKVIILPKTDEHFWLYNRCEHCSTKEYMWCALIRNVIILPCILDLAAQMWCLSRLLPLMLGDKVPETDRRWKNFLMLLEIMDYVFAPTLSQDHVAYLHVSIEEHHQTFIDLYPSCNITPKLHYMVHYPQWISR